MRFRTNAEGHQRVTVIPGDGLGPEVVAATRRIIDAAGVKLPEIDGVPGYARAPGEG